MIERVIFCLTLLALSGCVIFDPSEPYVHSRETVCGKPTVIMIVPALRTDGLAVWNDQRGVILLKRYPVCLEHEKKHICHGHWHDPKERNGEFCNV